MNHLDLMDLTTHMPRKVIKINGAQYLERYFSREDDSGRQEWYHRFLVADAERHLHSHPWTAQAEILCGEYVEETREGFTVYRAGMVNRITPAHLHRIVAVRPNTWTRLVVEPHREEFWYFINDAGDRMQMQTSERDWHKRYFPRHYGVNVRVGA